jgi:hypothetical protein
MWLRKTRFAAPLSSQPTTRRADPPAAVGLRPLMELTSGRRETMVALIEGPVAIDHPELASENIREVSGGLPAKCARSDTIACTHGTFVGGILHARRGSRAPAICPRANTANLFRGGLGERGDAGCHLRGACGGDYRCFPCGWSRDQPKRRADTAVGERRARAGAGPRLCRIAGQHHRCRCRKMAEGSSPPQRAGSGSSGAGLSGVRGPTVLTANLFVGCEPAHTVCALR